jgi:hypothetical protein
MSTFDNEREVRPLYEGLEQLEIEAGVFEAAQKERGEPFLRHNLGVRRGIRMVYFSVPDLEMRLRLIAKRRQIDNLLDEQDRRHFTLQRKSVLAKLFVGNNLRSAVSAVELLCIVAGFWLYRWWGLVAVLVAGYAIELACAKAWRQKVEQVVDAALDALRAIDDEERSKVAHERRSDPPYFSDLEAVTGEEEIRRPPAASLYEDQRDSR